MTIHVVVDVDVRPGQLTEAQAAFRELVTATLAEAGCLRFEVYVSEDEQNRLVLVETWTDQDAIDLHMKEEHTAHFLRRVDTVFPRPPQARRIRAVHP